MDFELDTEQTMLVDTVRQFVETELYPHEDLVERLDAIAPELQREIQTRAIAVGLYAANMPEALGGGGLDNLGVTLMERELGRASYALQMLVARPSNILRGCTGEQIDEYLLPTIRGERHDCLAMTEPNTGSDVRGMLTRAVRDGGDYVINGTKHFISHADMSDFVVLFAATAVEQTASGPKKKITDCRVPVRKRLGEEGRGFELMGEWLGATRLTVAATSVGRGHRVLDMATEWAATRKQFGQTIGRFQGTGFKLADMATELEAAELLTLRAAWKCDCGRMTDTDAAMAKLFASEALAHITDEALQIFGGMALIGPNCHGSLNYLDGVALWPDQHGGERVARGVAIVSQSGNIALNLTMQRRNLPLAYLITVGNKAGASIEAIVDALLQDDRVSAIGLHVEALDDVAAFSAVALRALAQGVPLVALKAGSSALGARTTVSHTGSLAGPDALYDALFQRLGIARVCDPAGLLETLKLLHVSGALAGRRIVSASCSGGEASLVALDKPVIAAVNGLAMGGGFELALAADLIVAADNAEFSLPEVRLGMLADSGGILRLPRRLPAAIAREMLMTGRRMGAVEAARWGLVNQVVAPGELLPAADALAREIVAAAPLAIAALKQVLRATEMLDVASGFQVLRGGSVVAYQAMLVSDDAREGPQAFAAKRPPVWRAT